MRAFRYFTDQYEGNPEPDLERYAHYGHVLYAHKASEGCFHVDKRHAARVQRAHEQGLSVLHYHYCRPDEGKLPKLEAQAFWAAVKPLWRPGDYLALDTESGAREWGGPWGVYTPELWNQLHQISGHSALEYGSTDFLRSKLPVRFVRGLRRWEAAYGPRPSWGPWHRPWWAWQLSDGQIGPQPHGLAGITSGDVSILRLDVALVLRARTARARAQARRRRR